MKLNLLDYLRLKISDVVEYMTGRKAEKDKVEKDKVEKERAERERAEVERAERERFEREIAERVREIEAREQEKRKIAKELAEEQKRIETERVENEIMQWFERIEKERAEREETERFREEAAKEIEEIGIGKIPKYYRNLLTHAFYSKRGKNTSIPLADLKAFVVVDRESHKKREIERIMEREHRDVTEEEMEDIDKYFSDDCHSSFADIEREVLWMYFLFPSIISAFLRDTIEESEYDIEDCREIGTEEVDVTDLRIVKRFAIFYSEDDRGRIKLVANSPKSEVNTGNNISFVTYDEAFIADIESQILRTLKYHTKSDIIGMVRRREWQILLKIALAVHPFWASFREKEEKAIQKKTYGG